MSFSAGVNQAVFMPLLCTKPGRAALALGRRLLLPMQTFPGPPRKPDPGTHPNSTNLFFLSLQAGFHPEELPDLAGCVCRLALVVYGKGNKPWWEQREENCLFGVINGTGMLV